ncbi:uncharacterized protein V1516DRAFT_681069 [Lipomyces oligophaga]|uniref:uncharacterized protein n=1 Tax=Lipomyces oligophaga TaxID=45792 RepID=UPI0034CF1526
MTRKRRHSGAEQNSKEFEERDHSGSSETNGINALANRGGDNDFAEAVKAAVDSARIQGAQPYTFDSADHNTELVQDGALDHDHGNDNINNDGFQEPKESAKRRKRKEKRKSRLFPTFEVQPQFSGNHISVTDLRDLVLWILADGIAPKWLAVNNKLAIKHVVTIIIRGLTPDMFGIDDAEKQATAPYTLGNLTIKSPLCPFFKSGAFNYIWPLRLPGDRVRVRSPMMSILTVPLSKKVTAAQQISSEDKDKQIKVTWDMLVMKPIELQRNLYPVHSSISVYGVDEEYVSSKQDEDQWVETLPNENETDKEFKIFGLDCEMVMTEHGSELARVTLVGWDRKIVLDELVLPDHAIVDYITRYSGITEEMLKNVTTTRAEIQKRLIELVKSTDILIGHSLENDLNSLKIKHPTVIDTALCFDHPTGPGKKPSLRHLAEKYLHRVIQQNPTTTGPNSILGHDSAEDARTCLDLVNLKIIKGLDYGRAKVSTEPLFRRIERAHIAAHQTNLGAEHATRTGTSAVVDYGNPGQFHTTDAKTIVSCDNDDQIVKGILTEVQRHDFVWARLRELEVCRRWDSEESGVSPQSAADEARLEATLQNLNERLTRIWNNLPPTTAVILLSGTGDPREMRRLVDLKAQFQKEYATKKWDQLSVRWTDVENLQLAEAVDIARKGISFVAIKPASDSS